MAASSAGRRRFLGVSPLQAQTRAIALRHRSANDGVTDLDALLAGRTQMPAAPHDGAFELHRIGDAVTSRNVHAAIYDALRLCMAL